METTSDLLSSESIECLTPERIETFSRALQRAIQEVRKLVLDFGPTYWSMPKRAQTVTRHGIYVSGLKQGFANQDGVDFRGDNGGFYLVFDEHYAIHFKKLNPKTFQAWIPRVMQQNREHKQLPLPGDFITVENRPLNEMIGIVLGVVENKLGEFVAFYFTIQDGDKVIRLPLEITTVVPFESPTDETSDIPSVSFTAVKKKSAEA